MPTKYLLPQYDQDSQRAGNLLKGQRSLYFQMEREYPLAHKPPLDNLAGAGYDIALAKELLKRRSSLTEIATKSGLKFTQAMPQLSTISVSQLLLKRDFSTLINYYLPDLGPILPHGRPQTLKDYEKLFLKDPLPPSSKNVDSDAAFAYTFVAGADPDMLRRMTKIPANFPITHAHFTATKEFAADDLTSALREGRIYFVDYHDMQTLKNGRHPQTPKYMYAPIAAFAVPRRAQGLVPFAIQTGQEAAGRTIYTPADDWSWKIARSTVLAAANAHSAIITHLSKTHLLMDPIAVCSFRHLSVSHPLRALLTPHFVNTLHINNSAFKSLVGKDQFVDRMLGSTIESNYELIAKNRLDFDFKANYLPAKFASQQTGDSGALALYPYRDDGLPIWNAISSWVSSYVSYYYRSESDIAEDHELQAWADEIASQKAGMVRNFAANGGVASIQQLIETLTMIIFTAGPQHAVVNFSQLSDLAYVPSAPMAGYTPEIKGKGHTQQDWLNFLPPLDVANVQSTLCHLLGGVYYSTLGDYGSIFSDTSVVEFLTAYNKKLATIETTINDLNRQRRPFTHLLPSKIPQSINI